MRSTRHLTDHAIRVALTPAAGVHAPPGLADGIRGAVDVTPQRQPGLAGWTPSPRTRLILQVATAGLLLLATLGAVLLAGSSRTPDAPMSVLSYRGGPERTGVMPGPGPAGAPRIEWSVGLDGPAAAGSPVVQDGTVYVADQSGSVSAIDAATGTLRWQHDVGAAIQSGTSLDNGIIVVGDTAGVIHALSAAAGGTELWAYRAAAPIQSASAVVDGVVYAASMDGLLYALDLSTGRPRWASPVDTGGPASRAIAVANGTIYAGVGGTTAIAGGSLGAYDAATGARRWTAALQPGNTSTPMVADGRVFVSGGLDGPTDAAHLLYALDTATGVPAWPAPVSVPSGDVLLPGAVADGKVFAESVDGSLHVLDAASGAWLWSLPIQATQSPSGGIAGGILYATSDDRKIHAVDVARRTELWSILVTGTPSAPAIVGGRIIVGTSLGQVVSVTGSAVPPGPSSAP